MRLPGTAKAKSAPNARTGVNAPMRGVSVAVGEHLLTCRAKKLRGDLPETV
jgi:hypothetical protein